MSVLNITESADHRLLYELQLVADVLLVVEHFNVVFFNVVGEHQMRVRNEATYGFVHRRFADAAYVANLFVRHIHLMQIARKIEAAGDDGRRKTPE